MNVFCVFNPNGFLTNRNGSLTSISPSWSMESHQTNFAECNMLPNLFSPSKESGKTEGSYEHNIIQCLNGFMCVICRACYFLRIFPALCLKVLIYPRCLGIQFPFIFILGKTQTGCYSVRKVRDTTCLSPHTAPLLLCCRTKLEQKGL